MLYTAVGPSHIGTRAMTASPKFLEKVKTKGTRSLSYETNTSDIHSKLGSWVSLGLQTIWKFATILNHFHSIPTHTSSTFDQAPRKAFLSFDGPPAMKLTSFVGAWLTLQQPLRDKMTNDVFDLHVDPSPHDVFQARDESWE